jgi:hypothetical protein
MEARLPFSSDYAVTVRGCGSVGEGADCPKGASNRLLVQDAIAVVHPGRWRVTVETADRRPIGRIRFDVVRADTSRTAPYRVRRYQ